MLLNLSESEYQWVVKNAPFRARFATPLAPTPRYCSYCGHGDNDHYDSCNSPAYDHYSLSPYDNCSCGNYNDPAFHHYYNYPCIFLGVDV